MSIFSIYEIWGMLTKAEKLTLFVEYSGDFMKNMHWLVVWACLFWIVHLITKGCVGFTCILAMRIFDLFQVHYMLKCSCTAIRLFWQVLFGAAIVATGSKFVVVALPQAGATQRSCCLRSFHLMGLEGLAELLGGTYTVAFLQWWLHAHPQDW